MKEQIYRLHIINILELVLSIIIASLISDTVCFNCFYSLHENQFINGCVYGHVIVNALMFIQGYTSNHFKRNWSILVAASGAIMFLATGIFILRYCHGYPQFAVYTIYIRVLIAGIVCLLLCATYAINLTLLLKREDCT